MVCVLNKSDISYLKTSWAFEHSDLFKGSPGSHFHSDSCSVGITSSSSLLEFPVLLSFTLSDLRMLPLLLSTSNSYLR